MGTCRQPENRPIFHCGVTEQRPGIRGRNGMFLWFGIWSLALASNCQHLQILKHSREIPCRCPHRSHIGSCLPLGHGESSLTRSYWGKAQVPGLAELSVNVDRVPCVGNSVRSPIRILFLVYLNKNKQQKKTRRGWQYKNRPASVSKVYWFSNSFGSKSSRRELCIQILVLKYRIRNSN